MDPSPAQCCTAQEWVLILGTLITGITGIIAALFAGLAAWRSAEASDAAKVAAAQATDTHKSVNSRLDEFVAEVRMTARAEGRALGVLAGQGGEVPPVRSVEEEATAR